MGGSFLQILAAGRLRLLATHHRKDTSMPDAKNNAKLTGDTHPPEVEDAKGSPQGRADTEGAMDGPADSSASRDVGNAGRDGKGTDQAGYGKDKDAPGLGHDKR
jgi:hypothetical protein